MAGITLDHPPRYSTAPRPDRPNLLATYERLAAILGYDELQPWQRYVASLATEIDPATGLPAYSEVCLSLPRQNGKSVLMSLVLLVRLLAWPADRQQVVMLGAQDALAARRLLVDVLWPRLRQSGLASAAGMRLRAGGLVDLRLANGNHLYLMSSNVSSGHGTTLSTAIVDECWTLRDDAALQSAGPAMLTVPDRQLWLCSTMGDERSIFWQAKVDRGRTLSRLAKPSTTCYVEWSAPDGADCDDPAVWAAANPAYGQLITESSISQLRAEHTEGSFRRAVLNQVITQAFERVIPELAWQECQQAKAVPEGGIVLGVDATPERSAASVVAADGRGVIEVVEHQVGADWVEQYVIDVWRQWGDVRGVAYITNGPLSGLGEPLSRAGVPCYSHSATQSAIASASFYDACLGTELTIRGPDVSLDNAVAAATRRPVGQAWAWGRASTDLDVSPLIAASMAYHTARELAATPPPRPPEVIDYEHLQQADDWQANLDAWSQVGVP